MLKEEREKVQNGWRGKGDYMRLQAGAKDQPESHCQRSGLGKSREVPLISGQEQRLSKQFGKQNIKLTL